MKACVPRSPAPTQAPAPTNRAAQGRSKPNQGIWPGGQTDRDPHRPRTRSDHHPSWRGAGRFPVWWPRAVGGTGNIQADTKGSRPDGAFSARPGRRCPLPGAVLRGPCRGVCPPPASGRGAGPAGCARPSICRAGARAGWGLFVTLLPRSPRSRGSGLRRSLPLAAAASAGAICCCRFWRSAIQKQTSSMTTNSYSQMY